LKSKKKSYPELTKEKLIELIDEFGLSKTSRRLDDVQPTIKMPTKREDLEILALAIEKYVKEKHGKSLSGGIQDNFPGMTDDVIRAYILTKLEEYPELISDKLYILVKEYEKYKQELDEKNKSTSQFNGFSRKILESYAVIAERYERKKFGAFIRASVEDRLKSMSYKDLTDFLDIKVMKNPELTLAKLYDLYEANY